MKFINFQFLIPVSVSLLVNLNIHAKKDNNKKNIESEYMNLHYDAARQKR